MKALIRQWRWGKNGYQKVGITQLQLIVYDREAVKFDSKVSNLIDWENGSTTGRFSERIALAGRK